MCPAGMFSYGLFSTTCQVCPKGTYSSAPGAWYCPLCPSNSVTVGGSAKPVRGVKGDNEKDGSAKVGNMKGKGGSVGSIISGGGATGCKCKKGYRSVAVKGRPLQCKSIKEVAAAAAAAAAANRKVNGTTNGTGNSGEGNKKMGGGDGTGKGTKKKTKKSSGSNRPFRNVTAADIHSRDPLTLEDEVCTDRTTSLTDPD